MNKAALAGLIAAVIIVIIAVSVLSYNDNLGNNEPKPIGNKENVTGKHYSVGLEEKVSITTP